MDVNTTQAGGGYLPVSLMLKGFKGILSGMGREVLELDFETLCNGATLVALAGANGRGKSTVMDNLHPYLVMPSRTGADGLGAFSYYDHVALAESEKVLVWKHRGEVYKSHLVIRVSKSRKMEAYLFRKAGEAWAPVVLADGTKSDGKVATYEHAVEAILGPMDTFFTSVFSAQGKRPLSAYKNGEIKSLLGDLLGLESIRAQGKRAAETASLLKASLEAIRTEQGRTAASIIALAQRVESAGDAASAVERASQEKSQLGADLLAAQRHAVQLESDAKAAESTDRRRAELRAERDRAVADTAAAGRRQNEEGQRLGQRLADLRQRAAARRRQDQERRTNLGRRRDAVLRTLAYGPVVRRAARQVPALIRVVAARKERVGIAQAVVEKEEALKSVIRCSVEQVGAIEREAGQVALRQNDLRKRFGLTQEVPCVGTDLQGKCQLLADAREAQALLPNVDGQLAQLASRKAEAQQVRAKAEKALQALSGAAERRNRMEFLLERSAAKLDLVRGLAARLGELDQAQDAAGALERELAELGEGSVAETVDEQAERQQIEEAQARLEQETAAMGASAQLRKEAAELSLAGLPAAYDGAALAAARNSLENIAACAQRADQAFVAATRQHEQLQALRAELDGLRAEKVAGQARAARIELKLSQWNLLAKCLSNDGVIALAIDDAGPTLAALANDLLLACYGPRFSLEVSTQTATAKGDMREDFDIIVHDGERDESKSLKLVSGGERVWINECLTRAIALYLATKTGREFGTLFSDEADGPLDPEHKRMFMEMKREVLRLGGYEREFFVTQTPELTSMADVVIDLDRMQSL